MSKRQGVMLATKFSAKRLSKWPTPYLVQPKINGMRCRVEHHGAKGGVMWVVMLSSQGNIIGCLPHLIEQVASLYWDYGVPAGIVFDGELYIPGAPIEDILSLCKRDKPAAGYEKVEYHVFDIIDTHLTEGEPQCDRTSRLEDLLYRALGTGLLPNIVLVPAQQAWTQNIDSILEEYVSAGHEGIIIRHPNALYKDGKSTDLMKLKPTKTDEFTILASVEEKSIQGELKGTLGAFVCIAKNGQRFKVGTGPALTRQGRQDLWDFRHGLSDCIAVITYQELSKRGVPLFPVLREVKFK